MNHRAFKCGGQVCRRLGRFGVVPNGESVRRRRVQNAIEIILTRTTLVVDQLRDTEAVNRVFDFGSTACINGNDSAIELASENCSDRCRVVCSR